MDRPADARPSTGIKAKVDTGAATSAHSRHPHPRASRNDGRDRVAFEVHPDAARSTEQHRATAPRTSLDERLVTSSTRPHRERRYRHSARRCVIADRIGPLNCH
ncbi:MAG: hypothetical protein U5L11_08220 [Arhodomonas sp.]|nr:hypothetical protein [Arhodomonas sp.]